MDKKRRSKTSRPADPQDANPAEGTTPSHIDNTKLVPPRGAGRIIARERLHAQLLDARRRRCFVLKGPAGCGKTTVMASWRQTLLPFGFDMAWLTLTADDNELTRFLDYLLASLAQVDPVITREATLLEGRGIDSEAVERTVITLVRGIASHPHELVLVLDDLHNLTDVGIHEALQWLIDYAPANLHLALVSRSAVPLSLARLRSQDLTLELDLRDLRFTPAESEQFLKAQLGDIDQRDARRMHELTDGWVAGLQLLSVSRKKSRQRLSDHAPAGKPAQGHMLDTQAFAKFFESEVLSHLSPTDLDLLLHMAVCNRFCASLCAALTGRPETVSEAASLLAHLESDNLFLIPIDGAERETWYRLHPLLRESLLKHFASRSEIEQRAVHARAWAWFRERDYLDEAVRHAVLGGEAAAAAALVEQHADALYARGDLRMLLELVRQLPAEQVQAHIDLRILMARMHLYARNFAACAESLDQLERDIPERDSDGRFRLAMLRATLAVQRDDTAGAMAVLPQLLHPPTSADAIFIGACSNILSWLYMHRGEYERARRIQLDRPPLLINGAPLLGTGGGSLLGRCLIGLSLALEGQMAQAERVYREVLYEAERCGKACADAIYLAAPLLGDALYETSDVDAAYRLLSDRVDILERVSIPDSVLRVLLVLAKSQWLAGNQLEAFAYLERLEEYAAKLGLDRLLAYSLAWRIYWHLLLGDLAAAEAKLAHLDAIDARHPDAEQSAFKEIGILTQHAHIRWQAARGDLDGAAQRLEQLMARCETYGLQLAVARLHMLGAVIDARRGLSASAHDKTLAALRLGHRLGLVRSLLDTDPAALDLIRNVGQSKTLDPVLAFYVERLQSNQRTPQQTSPSAPAPASPRRPLAAGMEALSEREVEVLRLLAQALPNKKIARALGLSPETVKWHLSHIYSKLGVNSRDEAVARARDLESSAGESSGSQSHAR
ncbi:MAG: LuxR C-terminal-related transcriptional regulator [Noviherbaspirillum sp.]